MASLPARVLASFQAGIPVSSLNDLDGEFNQLVGAAGFLKGGTTGIKLLIKSSDAADPPVDCDQIGAGPLARFKQNTVTKVTINNNGTITMVNTAVNPGLNADQVDGIEGANIAKLDTHKTAFSVSFGVSDPSTPPVGNIIPGMVSYLCPDGNAVTVTKIRVKYESQSHTTGGSVTFAVQRRQASDNYVTPTTLGTVTLDNTNSAIFQVYTNDLADVPLTAADTLIVFISARSGTVTERDVSVIVQGTQKFTT